jgi:hypothetical protein
VDDVQETRRFGILKKWSKTSLTLGARFRVNVECSVA